MKINRIILLLIPLMLIGPLSMDTYLPTLPMISNDLGVSITQVQFTLTSFVLGFCICQLFVGWFSAKLGASRSMSLALLLYALATAFCAYSEQILSLTIWRFVQAFAACFMFVLSTALVRRITDSQQDASRSYSILSASTALAPSLAPIIGAYLLILTDSWRSIFLFLLIFVSIVFWIYHFKIKSYHERLVPDCKSDFKWCDYQQIIVNIDYWRYALLGALCMSIIFLFFSFAPIIFIQQHHFSQFVFSVIFGIYGIFFMIGNLTSARFVTYFTENHLIKFSCIAIFCLSSIGWFILKSEDHLIIFLTCMASINACIGLMFGSILSMAMRPYRDTAEIAASIYGFQQFGLTFCIGNLVLTQFQNTEICLLSIILAISIAMVFLSTVKKRSSVYESIYS